MRHRKSGRKLNRESSHRLAMFKNMSISLLEHESIRTTLPKAKELRRFVEPLITLSKVDSVANRRLAYKRLGNPTAVKRLFEQMGPRYKTRPGGYLRLLKCGFRKGDAAPMAYVQLVDSIIKEEASDGVIEAEVVEPKKKVAKETAADVKAIPEAKVADEKAEVKKPEAKAADEKTDVKASEAKPADEKAEAKKPEEKAGTVKAEAKKPETKEAAEKVDAKAPATKAEAPVKETSTKQPEAKKAAGEEKPKNK